MLSKEQKEIIYSSINKLQDLVEVYLPFLHGDNGMELADILQYVDDELVEPLGLTKIYILQDGNMVLVDKYENLKDVPVNKTVENVEGENKAIIGYAFNNKQKVEDSVQPTKMLRFKCGDAVICNTAPCNGMFPQLKGLTGIVTKVDTSLKTVYEVAFPQVIGLDDTLTRGTFRLLDSELDAYGSVEVDVEKNLEVQKSELYTKFSTMYHKKKALTKDLDNEIIAIKTKLRNQYSPYIEYTSLEKKLSNLKAEYIKQLTLLKGIQLTGASLFNIKL